LEVVDEVLCRSSLLAVALAAGMDVGIVNHLRFTLLLPLAELVSVHVAGSLDGRLGGVLLEQPIVLVEEVEAELLVIDDGSDLTEFKAVYLHWKNII
jgi:hypothetical protein